MPSNSYKVQNTRRYERLKAGFLLRYSALHEDITAAATANTKDISPAGVRFTVSDNLPVGMVLQVQILLPPLQEKVSAFAQVVRVERGRPSSFYYVSASFAEIASGDFRVLEDFIKERLKSRESGFLFDLRDRPRRNPEKVFSHE